MKFTTCILSAGSGLLLTVKKYDSATKLLHFVDSDLTVSVENPDEAAIDNLLGRTVEIKQIDTSSTETGYTLEVSVSTKTSTQPDKSPDSIGSKQETKGKSGKTGCNSSITPRYE